jgi:hypothetical protein
MLFIVAHVPVDDPEPCSSEFDDPEPCSSEFDDPEPCSSEFDDPEPCSSEFETSTCTLIIKKNVLQS